MFVIFLLYSFLTFSFLYLCMCYKSLVCVKNIWYVLKILYFLAFLTLLNCKVDFIFGKLFVCNFLSLLLDDLPIFCFPDGLVFMFIFVVSLSWFYSRETALTVFIFTFNFLLGEYIGRCIWHMDFWALTSRAFTDMISEWKFACVYMVAVLTLEFWKEEML